MSEPMVIIYDKKLMRPACVLLQVAMGGHRSVAMQFDPQDWLTFPTPDLRPYTVTEEELEKVLKLTVKHRKAQRQW